MAAAHVLDSRRRRRVRAPRAECAFGNVGGRWQGGGSIFAGPVEVDETYMGGRRANMPKAEREKLTGRGAVGKTAIVGAKDRATNHVTACVVASTDKPTLHGFLAEHAAPDATIYSDEASAYTGLPNPHEAVKHSALEYVRGDVHTNGIESFWSMLKRAHKGTFHKLSPKHLKRYVREFAGKHNLRDLDTLDIMGAVRHRHGREAPQVRHPDRRQRP